MKYWLLIVLVLGGCNTAGYYSEADSEVIDNPPVTA